MSTVDSCSATRLIAPPIRRVHAHEKIEADRGKVALMRGPIVYCVEAADHAKDVNVLRLALPSDAPLKATYRQDLLGGLTVITGKALADRKTPTALTAIPYYAWANRGKNDMLTSMPFVT